MVKARYLHGYMANGSLAEVGGGCKSGGRWRDRTGSPGVADAERWWQAAADGAAQYRTWAGHGDRIALPSMPASRAFPVLVTLLLLAGCAGGPETDGGDSTAPAAPSSPGAGEETGVAAAPPVASQPPADEAAATCSAATLSGDLPAQPELPAAVAATREAIFAAATACDFAALDDLAPPTLRYSFGENVDAVAAWRAAEARGEPVLRWMAAVLAAEPAHEHGLWVWPGFFVRTVEEWSAADRREAERLLGEDFAALTGSGAYLGYRVGVAEDGTWTYFVAGD